MNGLLEILSSFNFTIDENTIDDQDVALDPELLGRVFENLLASYNPETATTARKATGSYYTPREIVDYMVTESLKAYFKTHLSAISDLDKKTDHLFSTGSEENPFDKSESKKIVELIESVRIVDPAVGSGAFPMGALNKLVFILTKVDPGNVLWKQAQLSAADTIPDSRIKQDTKNRIEEYFKGKNADYGRKLFLIQKCIYGVDIQQIAVEIAKLRFFISLLVDEKIDKTKENWGIEPLPNLDFKIMQGNSLLEEYEGVKLFDERLLSQTSKQELIDKISEIDLKITENDRHRLKHCEKNPQWMKDRKIDKPIELITLENNKRILDAKKATLAIELKNFDLTCRQGELVLYEQSRAKSLGNELKRLHKDFFETNEKKEKDKIKKHIEKIGWDLIEATLKEQNKTTELKKLKQFEKSNTKPFFLWKLHFADVFENGGFDIVIGNPPYVRQEEVRYKKLLMRQYGPNTDCDISSGRADLFVYFYAQSFLLLKKGGIVTFITSDKFITRGYAKKLRLFLRDKATILSILDFGERPIFEATVETCIFMGKKIKSQRNSFVFYEISSKEEAQNLVSTLKNKGIIIDQNKLGIDDWVLVKKSHQNLIDKLISKSQPLGEYVNNKIYSGVKTGKNSVFIITENMKNKLIEEDPKSAEIIKKWIVGNDINHWSVDWGNKYVIFVNKKTNIQIILQYIII